MLLEIIKVYKFNNKIILGKVFLNDQDKYLFIEMVLNK